MSNKKRLPRAAKRKVAAAVAAASECPDCGVLATKPRRERNGRGSEWVIDVPHDDSCPTRVLPHLRDGVGLAAVEAAQAQVRWPLTFIKEAGVVVAGER